MYQLEKSKKDTVLNVIDMYIEVLNYENKTDYLFKYDNCAWKHLAKFCLEKSRQYDNITN